MLCICIGDSLRFQAERDYSTGKVIGYLPGADAGASDCEPTEPVGEPTPGNVDWLICFVVDSPDGGTISPHDSYTHF